MNVVATTIKGIIEAQGLTYLRAANPNDLNELVHSYDLSNGVGVYANLPTVSNMTYSQNGNVLMEYGIEIYYLKLSTGTDDTATRILRGVASAIRRAPSVCAGKSPRSYV